MNHIFGDTDDISFGNNSSGISREVVSPRKPIFQKRETPHPVRTYTPPPPPKRTTPSSDRASVSLTSFQETLPLVRLVQGMKSSFLPQCEQTQALRLVPLSSAEAHDPLFLARRDDSTVLIGSGFSTIHRAGKNYVTFPDMRLLFSEKERIHAWILMDHTIDITPFLTILPGIGFPPIYGTREVIAKFRNSITDQTFLDSCRFFEIFADDMSERRIGDITVAISTHESAASLSLRVGTEYVVFSHLSVDHLSPKVQSDKYVLIPHEASWDIAGISWNMGEILLIQDATIEKQALKYTFDTFYIDGSSVGVVAGYTLGDREMLSENGVLTFTLEEDTRARTISGHIFIDSR
jgi:hypothetical protein